MGRPPRISEQVLLDAAREVFKRDGAAGSTAEIARRAGVSEATLFKRHRTKAALFIAAMAPPPVDAPGIIAEVEAIADPHQAVLVLGERVLEHFRIALPLAIPLISNPLVGFDELRRHFGRSVSDQLIDAITDYIAAQGKLGRLTARDPNAFAMALVACTHTIAQFEAMGLHATPMPPRQVCGVLDALWHGLRPDIPAETRPKETKP